MFTVLCTTGRKKRVWIFLCFKNKIVSNIVWCSFLKANSTRQGVMFGSGFYSSVLGIDLGMLAEIVPSQVTALVRQKQITKLETDTNLIQALEEKTKCQATTNVRQIQKMIMRNIFSHFSCQSHSFVMKSGSIMVLRRRRWTLLENRWPSTHMFEASKRSSPGWRNAENR